MDGSAEGILVLARFLDSVRQEIERGSVKPDDADADPDNNNPANPTDRKEIIRRTVQNSATINTKNTALAGRLILPVAMSLHPEARRSLNRCSVSPVQQLADAAQSKSRLIFDQNPLRQEIYAANVLIQQDKYDEGLAAFDELIKKGADIRADECQCECCPSNPKQ